MNHVRQGGYGKTTGCFNCHVPVPPVFQRPAFFLLPFDRGIGQLSFVRFPSSFFRSSNARIEKDAYNPYFGFTVLRRLTWESYVFSQIEHLKTSINYDSLSQWYYFAGGYGFTYYHRRLHLESIPITLGYEKRNPLKPGHLVPFYQIGASLLYSTVESRCWSDSLPLDQETKSGFG